LALFVLGKLKLEELLIQEFGTAVLAKVFDPAFRLPPIGTFFDADPREAEARDDLAKRCKLAPLLFYLATVRRTERNESECRSLMARCAAVANPMIDELEGFLARAESESPVRT
jgi:hypothetical protein